MSDSNTASMDISSSSDSPKTELDTSSTSESKPSSNPNPSEETKLLTKVVKSEEEAYRLYNDYGHIMGFSVRKGKQYNYKGTQNIQTKYYYCSKYKFIDGCKAMARFRVSEDGNIWKIDHFVKGHNHPLAKPHERFLLRSSRSRFFESIDDAINNYQPASISVQKVKTREVKVKGIEFESLLGFFKRKGSEDCMFYWDVQLDQKGRICNFFFRDGQSRIDYDCFGDVVFFDTGFKLDNYDLTCAPFVGVNHHYENIMFGCALLLHENADTFSWLFKSFFESMGKNAPKSIFTEQNSDMDRAIEQNFPNSRHRIFHACIVKNLMPRLSPFIDMKEFHKIFNRCLNGWVNESESGQTWSKMLTEFKLEDHKWLNNLYKIRVKWCSALNRYAFNGGLECNDIFEGIVDKSGTISDFILSVEKLTKDWRERENEDDINLTQKPIVCAIKHSDILNQAARVYTYKIYKLFESEFLDACGATFFKEVPQGGTIYEFKCTNQERGSVQFNVLLDTSNVEVSCDCKKFETMGILCSHCLKALSVKNVRIIPEKYIVKRWCKNARKRVFSLIQNEMEGNNGNKNAEVAYFSNVMRYAYDLVLKSQRHEELRGLVWDALEGGQESLEKFWGQNTNSKLRFLF